MNEELMRKLMLPVDARGKMGILSRGKNIYHGGLNGPTHSKNKLSKKLQGNANINAAIMDRFRSQRKK